MQIPSAPSVVMPKKRRKEKRARALEKPIRGFAAPVALALASFLAPLPCLVSVPSPFAAALIAAVQPRGFQSVFPMLGVSVSLLFRMLWGIELDLWQYVGCLLLLAVINLTKKLGDRACAALAGLCLLPRAIEALLVGGASYPFWLALLSCALSACACFGMKRGLTALQTGGALMKRYDKACAAILLLPLLAALGYLRVSVINLGHVAAVFMTILLARIGGLTGGAAGGLLCGLALSLAGHDSQVALCLALGGMTAGLLPVRARRFPLLPLFLLGYYVALYASESTRISLSIFSAAVGGALFLLMPESLTARARAMLMNAAPVQQSMDGAFVQAQLEKWELALSDMARALPPESAAQDEQLSAEIRQALCLGCAEADCEVWEALCDKLTNLVLDAPNNLRERVEMLRTSGCIRVHRMEGLLERLITQRRLQQNAMRKAAQEREMTRTHLCALAQTISRTRELTRGETLCDMQAAYQIRQAIRALNLRAELYYCRRVDGHLQAALRAESFSLGGKAPQRLLRKLEKEEQLPLAVTKYDKGRIELEELPLYTAEVGVAAVAASESETGVSGDSILIKKRSGGRFLLALSDGMGHGQRAHQESEKTLELLALCLEAGYSRRQAISAVNGMMLSSFIDERFATVDLFDLDLWTGEAVNEKLGAAPSYVVRGNYIKRVEGSSLPLGILQEIVPTSQRIALHSGDILIVLSDGVSDAFETKEALEAAVRSSLYIQPQRMADALLRSALMACAGRAADDMTVMAMLLYDQNRSAHS